MDNKEPQDEPRLDEDVPVEDEKAEQISGGFTSREHARELNREHARELGR